MNGDLHFYIPLRAIVLVSWQVGDFIYHVHAFDYFSKYSVIVIEEWCTSFGQIALALFRGVLDTLLLLYLLELGFLERTSLNDVKLAAGRFLFGICRPTKPGGGNGAPVMKCSDFSIDLVTRST